MQTLVRAFYKKGGHVTEALYESATAGAKLQGSDKAIANVVRVEFYRWDRPNQPYHCLDSFGVAESTARLDGSGKLTLDLKCLTWLSGAPGATRLELEIELDGTLVDGELKFSKYGKGSGLENGLLSATARRKKPFDQRAFAASLKADPFYSGSSGVDPAKLEEGLDLFILSSELELQDRAPVYLLCCSADVEFMKQVRVDTALGPFISVPGPKVREKGARVEWIQTRETLNRCDRRDAAQLRRWLVRVRELQPASACNFWNVYIDEYLAALGSTQGSSDMSFAYRLTKLGSGWGIALLLQPPPVQEPNDIEKAIPSFSIHALNAPSAESKEEARLTYPRLAHRDDPAGMLEFITVVFADESLQLSEYSPCLAARCETLGSVPRAKPHWLRVGSLDMALDVAQAKSGHELSLYARPVPATRQASGAARHIPLITELALRYERLTVIDPNGGAEDPVPDELRSRYVDRSSRIPTEQKIAEYLKSSTALVFQLDRPNAGRTAILYVEESTAPDRARGLVMRLRRDPTQSLLGTQPPISLAYISREPFLVALVELPPLSTLEADYDEIGNRSLSELEGSRWELAAASGGFSLLLPPQTIGEEMEKSSAQPILGMDAPVDFRLGSPARLSLRSSYFRQRAVEAPWNLRRVLGYPGQRAPGALARHLSFELAYGLNTDIDASEVQTRLHVAEVGSRLGALSPPVDRRWADGKSYEIDDNRRDAFHEYRLRWARALAAYRSRLAILELYAPGEVIEQTGAGPERATGSLTLEQGLTFSLREKADLQYPIHEQRRAPGSTLPNKKPHSPDGLRGGVTWPFESDAIYHGLWRQPTTRTGMVSGLFFSSVGGYGRQRAAFDNKRTLITSTTVMGRLTRMTIERVGRIAVLWNHARHVIVYERTTLASEQFWKTQAAHEGRAVLRKVEEYIEILQPSREYPDFGRTRLPLGCVEASSFVSRKIPVDGTWGRDIDGGFEIPLWSPTADPRVYPKPAIKIATAGDGETCARVATPLRKPERLFFYSSTAPDLDDQTDLWPSVLDVDYTDEPEPEQETDEPVDATDPDGQLPDVVTDPQGWERFTWPLDEPSHPSNIVVERSPEPLCARVHAVTMMRGASTAGVDVAATSALRSASRVRASLAQSRTELMTALTPAQALTPAVHAKAKREIDRARGRLDKLKGSLQDARNEFDKRRPDLKSWQQGLCNTARTQVASRISQSLDTTTRILDEWRAGIEAELEEFVIAKGKLPAALAHDHVDRWTAELRAIARPLSSGLEEVTGFVTELRDQVLQTRTRLLEDFDQIVAPLEIGGLSPELASSLTLSLDRAVVEWLQSLTDGLPKNLPERAVGIVQRIRARLEVELRKLITDAVAALLAYVKNQTDEALPPLADRIETLRLTIFGELDDSELDKPRTLSWPVIILDDAVKKLAPFSTEFAPPAVDRGLDDLAGALHTAIDGLGANVDPTVLRERFRDQVKVLSDALLVVRDKLEAPLTKAVDGLLCDKSGPLAWLQDIDKLVDGWDLGKYEKALGDLETALNNAVDAVDEKFRDLLADLDRQFAGVIDGADDVYSAVRTALKDLDKSPTFQNPSETLRLLRAVGEGPLLPEMKFNRDRIGYFFDDYAAAVRTSPVAALVNRVGNDLKALGMRVPMSAALDRVIPDNLQNYDLSKILPDFAALRNSALFRKIRLPAIANDKVRVQTGVDKATLSPWLKARVDVPLSGKADVFSIGPLALRLLKAEFHARADMTVTVGRGMQKHMDGEIAGDWQLAFGGAPIVTFVDTKLRFDASGKMRFDINPANIQMDRALKFLADLIRKMGDDKNGFTLELMQHNGMPIGVRCSLLLPLPPISGGAFSISGLTMGASLMLMVDPQTREFTIAAGFNLGEKAQPFTLTISFLGGGGWLESQAMYMPSSGRLISHVSIGMVAGAGTAFAFGPARGAVYIQFGIFIEFHSESARGHSLSVGIMLLVRGNVVLCGFVNITIMLLLQAIYQDSGSLVGFGTLSVTVKISRFFKIRVRQQIKYQLKGKGSGGKAAARAARRGFVAASNTGAPTSGPVHQILANIEQRALSFQ